MPATLAAKLLYCSALYGLFDATDVKADAVKLCCRVSARLALRLFVFSHAVGSLSGASHSRSLLPAHSSQNARCNTCTASPFGQLQLISILFSLFFVFAVLPTTTNCNEISCFALPLPLYPSPSRSHTVSHVGAACRCVVNDVSSAAFCGFLCLLFFPLSALKIETRIFYRLISQGPHYFALTWPSIT